MPFPSHIFLRTRSLAKSITTLCITAQRTHPQIFFSPPPRFPPLRPEVLSPDRLKICTNCKPPLASRTGIKRTPRGYLLDGHWRSFTSTRHYLKSSYRRIMSHTILHRRRSQTITTSTLAVRCAALLKQTWKHVPKSPRPPEHSSPDHLPALQVFHTGGLTLATLVLTCLYCRYSKIHHPYQQTSQHEWHDGRVGMY